MNAPARFCANCGAPTDGGGTHCGRCGMPLPGPAASAAAAPDGGGRSGIPSALIGLAACLGGGFFFLVCGGILTAIAIPNFLRYQARARAETARTNLEILWAAEKQHASENDGEYVEFYVEDGDRSDEGFAALGLVLGTLHHTYEGYYDSNDDFVITASGNVDEDDSPDEWLVGSLYPNPQHTYDDIAEREMEELTGAVGIRANGEEPHHDDGGDDDEAPGGEVLGGLRGTELPSSGDSGRRNLEALWERQQAYRLAHPSYLPFRELDEGTREALGLESLPAKEEHVYSGTVSGGVLTLSAVGNIDGDPFVDEWELSSQDGIPLRIRNDALDLDLTELAAELRKLGKKQGKSR